MPSASRKSQRCRAGYADGLALDVLTVLLEHFGGEVEQAVAGGFGSRKRAAIIEAFAGQDALVYVLDFLYWPNI